MTNKINRNDSQYKSIVDSNSPQLIFNFNFIKDNDRKELGISLLKDSNHTKSCYKSNKIGNITR